MPQRFASLPNPASLGSADHRVLQRVFQHPLSHNLSWREALALIGVIGRVEHAHDGNVVLTIGEAQQTFRASRNKDLATGDVMALRHFLTSAGWAPDADPPPPEAASAQDLVIFIDHAEARIYRIASDDGQPPVELHHLRHDIERRQHDADREETFPADRRFFDAIAVAATGSGRIIVVGYGKGQSNEADHLMTHLAQHCSAVHARVAREIVADLPRLTVPELVRLARHALQSAQSTTITGGR